MKQARAAVLQKFVHLMTALTIFAKAVSKLEQPEGYWPVIVFLIASGIYIVTITILHDRLHRHERHLTASVYAIECVAMGITAWLYAADGKRGLPWVLGLAAVLFFVAMVVRLTAKPRGNGAAAH